MLRFLLWRLLGLVAWLLGLVMIAWLLGGGPGRALRGSANGSPAISLAGLLDGALRQARELLATANPRSSQVATTLVAAPLGLALLAAIVRWNARRRRAYVRLRVEPYRADRASAEAVVTMFETLQKRLLQRWWRRFQCGQPSLALEVHHACEAPAPRVWLAVCCPSGAEAIVEAALRAAYPNCRAVPIVGEVELPPVVLRLKKAGAFIKRVKRIDRFEHERVPAVNRLLTAMAACESTAVVQLALTPAPASFERLAKHLYKRHEARLARERREHVVLRDRSMVDYEELRGGLDVQHRPLFFADLRIAAPRREVCERISSELRAEGAENRLVERGTSVRHGVFGLYRRRLLRGEGNALPSLYKGAFAATELASLWHMPSSDYMTVPFKRSALPLAPAPPTILRPDDGTGALRDALGPVSIHPQLRKQNTAVPGAVEQGKSSYLIGTMADTVQFLDSPRGEHDDADSGEDESELAGVGAEEKDLAF